MSTHNITSYFDISHNLLEMPSTKSGKERSSDSPFSLFYKTDEKFKVIYEYFIGLDDFNNIQYRILLDDFKAASKAYMNFYKAHIKGDNVKKPHIRPQLNSSNIKLIERYDILNDELESLFKDSENHTLINDFYKNEKSTFDLIKNIESTLSQKYSQQLLLAFASQIFVAYVDVHGTKLKNAAFKKVMNKFTDNFLDIALEAFGVDYLENIDNNEIAFFAVMKYYEENSIYSKLG